MSNLWMRSIGERIEEMPDDESRLRFAITSLHWAWSQLKRRGRLEDQNGIRVIDDCLDALSEAQTTELGTVERALLAACPDPDEDDIDGPLCAILDGMIALTKGVRRAVPLAFAATEAASAAYDALKCAEQTRPASDEEVRRWANSHRVTIVEADTDDDSEADSPLLRATLEMQRSTLEKLIAGEVV